MQVRIYLSFKTVLSKFTFLYKIDDRNRTQQSREPFFIDSSGPFFTLYSKAAEDEDNKMVESWQKDAKGILIFVSSCIPIHIALYTNWSTRPVYSLPQLPHSLL